MRPGQGASPRLTGCGRDFLHSIRGNFIDIAWAGQIEGPKALAAALFRADKTYKRAATPGARAISDPTVRQAQQQRIMEFFARTVRGAGQD